MKKIITCILFACTIVYSAMFCHATSFNNFDELTIVYHENSIWTETQKEQFASLISSDTLEYNPYSLKCLFGHDEVIEYPHIIKHKALSVEPRCASQVYEVITCTRCEYMDATLISQLFIFCCPKD